MQQSQLKQEVGSAFNEFKALNDQPNKDALILEKLDKVTSFLDKFSQQKQAISSFSPPISTKAGLILTNQDGGTMEQKSGFLDYARGDSVSGNEVGYVQSERINQLITDYLSNNSVIRRFAKQILISRDSLEYVKNKLDVQAEWSDGTTGPNSIEGYEKVNIKVNDLIAQPKVTQKLLSDVQMDFEAWLASELGQIFLNQENEAFINGDGVNKPRGILSYLTGDSAIEQIKTKDAAKITVDGLIDLVYSLSDVYSNNSVMLMNKTTVQEVRKLKDSNGQYLWMPGILSGKADTIMGVTLQTISNIPSVSANSICAIYANLEKAYVIADHEDIIIQKDPFSAKPFVSFYCTKRVGGDVINSKAVKLLKVAV